jgi:hypothetical protein
MLQRFGIAALKSHSLGRSSIVSRATNTARMQTKQLAARASLSTTTPLPQVLPKPEQEDATLTKSIQDRLWDRFSFRGQQHRIFMGEHLFQAARQQSHDPYVYSCSYSTKSF